MKLVEQLEEVRKEKNELLKQIKKEQRKAEKQESSQVPDTQETVAEELKVIENIFEFSFLTFLLHFSH